MRSLVWMCMFIGCCLGAGAQAPINNPIAPGDTQLTEAVRFLQTYLAEFDIARHPTVLPDFGTYWPPDDCIRFRIPDRLLHAINTDIPTYMMGKPKILYAHPIGDIVHISTMFAAPDTSGLPLVTSITNHYVKKWPNGHYYFINPMYLQQQQWEGATYNNIQYYFPAYHKWDKARARQLYEQINKLEEEWNLRPIGIRYYFADTREEIDRLRGFDFTISTGNRDKPGGISDGVDNVIYCWGLGENYLHEVVHLYLNPLFPKSPLREGLAVYYGGSMGHDVRWHLARLDAYLKQHPEVDLNNIDDFYYMDNNTNPMSTIQGLLCLMAYEKGGMDGLRRTMAYTSVAKLLQQEYGVAAGGWNAFLREQIGKNSK